MFVRGYFVKKIRRVQFVYEKEKNLKTHFSIESDEWIWETNVHSRIFYEKDKSSIRIQKRKEF